MPPPTRQGSRAQIEATIAALSPWPFAASRSISCTRGKRENFLIHGSGSGASIASFSPWTSWTTWPSWRSMDGNQHGSRRAVRRPECPRCAGSASGRRRRYPRSERSTPRAPRRHGRVVKTSAKCSRPPAPPEAITGMFTASETAAVSSQSKPARVPSRSIDVSRISPAPRASASRAHSTASRAASAVPLRTKTPNRPSPRRHPLRVDRDDDRLAAVAAGERGDQLRVAQRRGVEADLVGAGLDGRGRGALRRGCRRRRSAAGRSRARRR